MGLLYEYISESSTLSDSMNVSILPYSDSFIFEDINTVDMFGFPP